ncbi:MAG: DNA-binding protein [Euzebyales bacterium]|nr:DNA-binding protein [Euzebyales bacterium]
MAREVDPAAVADRVRDVVAEWPPEELAHLLEELADPAVADSTAARSELFGPPPSPADVVVATLRNTARLWERRGLLAETALTRAKAAERLGVSPNQITNLISDGHLVAFDHAGARLLPAWQFHADSSSGRVDGVREVAAVFPGGVVSLSAWATTRNAALGGRTPAQALLDGDVDRVVAVVEHGTFGA